MFTSLFTNKLLYMSFDCLIIKLILVPKFSLFVKQTNINKFSCYSLRFKVMLNLNNFHFAFC